MDADNLGLCELPEGVSDWATARDTDASYQAVTDEIARMSSMTESAASPPDWGLIVKSGSDILATRAKDIQIASYAAVGMMNTGGMAGFSNGIKVLGDIFSAHSETAFPPKKRKRARLNAVAWWLERAVAWLESAPNDEMAYDFATDLNERIQALDEALAANFDDEAPLLSELRMRVGMLPVAPPPQEPEAAAEPEDVITEVAVDGDGQEGSSPAAASKPASSSPAASASVPVPTPSAAPKTAEEARRVIRGLLSSSLDAGSVIASEANADPLPYRLRRLSAWSFVAKAPPAENGRTMLPGPEAHVVQALDSLMESGDYAGALALAEEQVGVYLFWMDPQRVAAQALSALGAPYRLAQTAVEMETLYYLTRVPSLTKLSFTDGTPFADPKTRSWLAELSDRGGSSGGAQENQAVREALDKARELSATNPEEALGVLSQASAVAGHPRDELLLRIEVLKTFIASGRMEAARAQIQTITDILDRFNLDVWDPELASRALSGVLSALSGEPGETDVSPLCERLTARLALCSPVHYFRST